MHTSRPAVAAALALTCLTTAVPAAGAAGGDGAAADPPRQATATGRGGAVTSVDPEATEVGLSVLRRGGNAVDAAVATAAALGVTEPYSSGIGGGGYFLYYDARSKRVHTLDGRETAPRRTPKDAFIDPSTGKPYTFTPDLVTSGVSVGTPGTPATWQRALSSWGTRSLRQSLAPASALARRGFTVDQTFHDQTDDNKDRFAAFPATSKLFLPGGQPPAVGSTLRNPDLARTYDRLGREGTRAFYRGSLARQMADVVQRPRTAPNTDLPVPRGYLSTDDLADYRVRQQRATTSSYRGMQVHGMAPSSSGGTTVGEALNILDQQNLRRMSDTRRLHYYLEAGALAYADRAEYVGDPRFTDVPTRALTSPWFARSRGCTIDPDKAASKPVAAGSLTPGPGCTAGKGTQASDTENVETTNLTTADRWGNVVEYTLTIEQTGGSGQVVPGRGFLLNNELTDFSLTYDPSDPNRLEPGKRPRSSIAPTLLTRNERPVLALGSPGGASIITTVLQTLLNRYERGMTLPQAIAAPRVSPQNKASESAEPAFIERYGAALERYGHRFTPAGDGLTGTSEIGAATAIEFDRHGRLTAAAEPSRRGGGAAGVVHPGRG